MTAFSAMLSASLAYADAPANANDNLILVMSALALLAGTVILAAIPLLAARRRRADALMMAAMLWAFLTGGLALFTLFSHAQWSKENMIRMQSGYYDPSIAAPPSWHWTMWAGLALAYIVLLAVVFSGRRAGGGTPGDGAGGTG